MTNASRWTRRDFLRTGAAAAAIPAFIPGIVLGLDGGSPPSETVRVGVIGCGGRSQGCDSRRGRRQGIPGRGSLRLPNRKGRTLREGAFRRQAVARLCRLPQDDRAREARRRDDRNHHARPGLDRDPRHAGRHARLHREADGPDRGRRPDDGPRSPQVPARDAGRHAAALHAHQQLGQRPGEERRHRQSAYRARPELHQPDSLDQDLDQGRQAAGRAVVGRLDEPGRVAALLQRAPCTAGEPGGTTTAAATVSA